MVGIGDVVLDDSGMVVEPGFGLVGDGLGDEHNGLGVGWHG